jgi:hypothetical protein
MQFGTADLAAMQANGTIGDVITHEMGHVLGIGTIWSVKGPLSGIVLNRHQRGAIEDDPTHLRMTHS